MQRGAIRVLADGTVVDVPFGAFTTAQYLYFDGSTVGTTTVPPGITTPSSTVVDQVATWGDTTGGELLATAVTINSAGNVNNVLTINGIDPSTWVVGPSSATDDSIATFNLTTGKLIQSTVVTLTPAGDMASLVTLNTKIADDLVTCAFTATDGQVAVFDGSSGRAIRPSADTFVTGPGPGTTANQVPVFDDTGGDSLKSTTITIDIGNIDVPGTVNGKVADNLVEGPGSSTTNRMTAFDGTDGATIRQTDITESAGALTGVVSINGQTLGDFVTSTSASATISQLATFANANGKVIFASSPIIADGSGGLTGVVSINATAWGDVGVRGTGTGATAPVAVFDGTEYGHLASRTVLVSTAGDLTGVTTINGQNPDNWVVCGTATTIGQVAVFNSTDGTAITNTNITITGGDVVSNVATINGRNPSLMVEGTFGHSNNQIAIWSGVGTNDITFSAATADGSGNISGVNNINGKLADNLVTSSGAAVTFGTLATFTSATGIAGANPVTLNGSGQLSGLVAINGTSVSDFSTRQPGAGVAAPIAVFDGPNYGDVSSRSIFVDTSAGVTGVGSLSASGTISAPNLSATTNLSVGTINSTISLSGGVVSGVTTLNGITPQTHGTRHAPGGADSAFDSGFQTNDRPIYAGAGVAMSPRWQSCTGISGASVGSSALTPSGATLTFPSGRTASYHIRWVFPYTLGDSSGDIEIRGNWSSATSGVTMVTAAGGALHTDTNNGLISVPTSGLPGEGVIEIMMSLVSATSGSQAYYTLRKSSGVGFTADAGGFLYAFQTS